MKYETMSTTIKPNVTKDGNKLIFHFPCSSSNSCVPYKISFKPGVLQISLYGAQGGDARRENSVTVVANSGGKGAFVQGRVFFQKQRSLFLYIGGAGETQSSTARGSFGRGGYNGGGDGGTDGPAEGSPESGAGGGGATDIRLNYGDDFEAYKSRIIVAAGGGGANSGLEGGRTVEFGGYGGSLQGSTTNDCSVPGTQTSGSFGFGENGTSSGGKYNGGAGGNGGGYYGGTSCNFSLLVRRADYEFGGAGGSSFIAGHIGCNAIDATSTKSNIKPLETSVFNNYFSFFNTQMKSGNEYFVGASGLNEYGHSGNGIAIIERISYYHEQFTCKFQHYVSNTVNLMSTILLSMK